MTSFEFAPVCTMWFEDTRFVHSTKYTDNILRLQVGYLTDIMYYLWDKPWCSMCDSDSVCLIQAICFEMG